MNTLSLINVLIIISAFLTMFLVVLNQPETSQTFGGKNSFERTRRGFEKSVHRFTIVSASALVVLVLLAQIVK